MLAAAAGKHETSWGPTVLADDPCLAACGAAGPEYAGQYYRARYYDPRVGRFISEDPVGLRSAANPYQYVEANPTTMIDPMGLKGFTWSGQCAAQPPISPLRRFIQWLNTPPFAPPPAVAAQRFLNNPDRSPCPGNSLFEALFPCNTAFNLGASPNLPLLQQWKDEFGKQCASENGKTVFKDFPVLGSPEHVYAGWCCKCEDKK